MREITEAATNDFSVHSCSILLQEFTAEPRILISVGYSHMCGQYGYLPNGVLFESAVGVSKEVELATSNDESALQDTSNSASDKFGAVNFAIPSIVEPLLVCEVDTKEAMVMIRILAQNTIRLRKHLVKGGIYMSHRR